MRFYKIFHEKFVKCKKKFQKLVDAQEFYTNEEVRLTALVEEEKRVALSKRLGIAFVTLGKYLCKLDFYKFKNTFSFCFNFVVKFSGTPGDARAMRRQLRSSPAIKWTVNYAPAPSDIFWENLSITRPCWYLNAFLINVALGLFLFFITTPVVSSERKKFFLFHHNENESSIYNA